MKKISKVTIVMTLIILLVLIIIPQPSFAVTDNIADWNFNVTSNVPSKLVNVAGVIIRVLRNVAIMITVVVITALGIKYMVGSVQEKADYKKNYINIIIGVVLITMVTAIIDVIFNIANA